MLAHIRAWQVVTSLGGADDIVILEDNVRGLTNPCPLELVKNALSDPAAANAPLIFLGYLGSEPAVEQLHGMTVVAAASGDCTAELREGVNEANGAKFDLLWGTYAYHIRPHGIASIMGTSMLHICVSSPHIRACFETVLQRNLYCLAMQLLSKSH